MFKNSLLILPSCRHDVALVRFNEDTCENGDWRTNTMQHMKFS